jgi:hypothetical protein
MLNINFFKKRNILDIFLPKKTQKKINLYAIFKNQKK